MNKIILLCLAIGETLCTNSSTPSIVEKNKQTLQSDGVKVGTFEDGSELRCCRIDIGNLMHPHYIYRIIPKNGQKELKEPDVTTINHMQGKVNGVTVVIDGVEYTPVIERTP